MQCGHIVLYVSILIRDRIEMKTYNLLVVEDEPLMCDYYRIIITEMNDESSDGIFKPNVRHTFEAAVAELSRNNGKVEFDIAILDLRLLDRNNNTLNDGSDLGKILREKYPNCKIIFFSSIVNQRKLYEIFTDISPEGFWVKDEIKKADTIKKVIQDVLERKTSYSPLVTDFLKNLASGSFELDQIDRNLIYHLSEGVKNKDLPNHLNLSLSSIEKRKRNILRIFDVDSWDEAELIRSAKSKGVV